MNWTDKFIGLPVKLIEAGDANLGVQDTYVDGEIMVNPVDIVAYNSTFDNAFPGTPVVRIVLRSGEGYMCYLSRNDFEEKMNAFYNQKQ